jgi:hypothetical protein
MGLHVVTFGTFHTDPTLLVCIFAVRDRSHFRPVISAGVAAESEQIDVALLGYFDVAYWHLLLSYYLWMAIRRRA